MSKWKLFVSYLSAIVIMAMLLSVFALSSQTSFAKDSPVLGNTSAPIKKNIISAENMVSYGNTGEVQYLFTDVINYKGIAGDSGVLCTITPKTAGAVSAFIYFDELLDTTDISVDFKVLGPNPLFGYGSTYVDWFAAGLIPSKEKNFSDVDASALVFMSQWDKSCRVPYDGTIHGKSPFSTGWAVNCGAYGFADDLLGNDYNLSIKSNFGDNQFLTDYNKFFREDIYHAWGVPELIPNPYGGDYPLTIRPDNLPYAHFSIGGYIVTENGFAPKPLQILIKNITVPELDYINEPDIGAGYEHILRDRKFTDSFGCEWTLGRVYSVDSNLRMGDVLYYKDIGQPFSVLTKGLATTGVGSGGLIQSSGLENTVSWQFEEGLKENFMDLNGQWIPEYHGHRMAVNSNIEVNTPDKIRITQYNDYLHNVYPWQYPVSNPKLAKVIESNRQGRIKVSYNSYNDISNSSYAYGAQFAHNTWPHLLLHQSFSEFVDLSKYIKIDFGMDIKVNKAQKINNWPQGYSDRADQPMPPGGAPVTPSETTLQTYFFVRHKSNPYIGAFVGVLLSSSNYSYMNEYSGVEQNGIGFYRVSLGNAVGSNFFMEGNWVEPGQNTSFSLELKSFLNYVFSTQFGNANPSSMWYQVTADDVYLSMFNVGYEYVGNWDCEYEISNVHARGILKY